MSAAQTLTLASSKASKNSMEARLAELEALLKAKDAEIESLRSRPGHRKAFSQRNLHAAVIANPRVVMPSISSNWRSRRGAGTTERPRTEKEGGLRPPFFLSG